MNVEFLTELNEKVVQIANTIKLLGPLSWPASTEVEFLKSWEAGNPKLPEVAFNPVDYSEQKNALNVLLHSFTAEHPLEIFTKKTIESYLTAADMIAARGTPTLQALSLQIYGQPGDKMPGCSLTNIDAAEKLIAISKFFNYSYAEKRDVCTSAAEIKEYLDHSIQQKFEQDGPTVVITDELSSKATAGRKRVRLRNDTCFTVYDHDQLLIHEVMTHSLTVINGTHQPILKTLSLGAPRTTATQEGLATFAEVITGNMDLNRLNRLALRIVAIDKALKGAEFIDIFRFFLENGQSAKESFWSSARVFRGGAPNQGIIFTKDSIYLDGLIKAHTLFRWAFMNGRLDLTNLLFCGRLTIDDLFLLEDAFLSGLISPPTYYPNWYERIDGLAGRLGFSLLANMVRLDELEDYFSKKCHS